VDASWPLKTTAGPPVAANSVAVAVVVVAVAVVADAVAVAAAVAEDDGAAKAETVLRRYRSKTTRHPAIGVRESHHRVAAVVTAVVVVAVAVAVVVVGVFRRCTRASIRPSW